MPVDSKPPSVKEVHRVAKKTRQIRDDVEPMRLDFDKLVEIPKFEGLSIVLLN